MSSESSLTLRQALQHFQERNAKYFSEKPDNAPSFLADHDVTHVVFGCDTSLYGEGVVKVWTTFGTTLSFWKVVRGYKEADAFELSRNYSFRHVTKNIFRFLCVIPKTIIRAKRMHKPWPFSDYQSYLDVPIIQIREEFNIRVIT